MTAAQRVVRRVVWTACDSAATSVDLYNSEATINDKEYQLADLKPVACLVHVKHVISHFYAMNVVR